MSADREWSYREQFKRNARYVLHETPNGRVPVVINAEEVVPEKIQWLWPGRLARGKITLLEGDPGLGKSTLTIEIAARLSRGQQLPGGLDLPPLGTLFLAAEDGVADTIVPRLMAAGADLTKVRILDGIKSTQGTDSPTIPDDLEMIEKVMLEHASALVVVDPLSVFFGDDINENRNQEVKRALAPLKSMLERSGAAGLPVRHLNKQSGGKAIYRGAGSIGLGGIARMVMTVGKDPEQEQMRVLANVKENLSRPQASLAYEVVSHPDNPDVATVVWRGDSVWNADDLGQEPDPEETGKLAEAKDWLRDYLQGGVIVKSKQVFKDAAADDHKEKTLRRAQKLLGIRPIKNPADGCWGWKLPEDGQKVVKDGQGKMANDPRAYGNVDHLDHLPQTPHNNNNSSWPSSLATFEGGHGHLQTNLTNNDKVAKVAKVANLYEVAPWEQGEGTSE